MRKPLALILIFVCIFQFSFFSFTRPVQAIIGVDDAIEISILAGALVESGAVGEVEVAAQKYGGSLWVAAQSLYYSMAPEMMDSFVKAASIAETCGYFYFSQVPGLSDYVDNHLNAQDLLGWADLAMKPAVSTISNTDWLKANFSSTMKLDATSSGQIGIIDGSVGSYLATFNKVLGNNYTVTSVSLSYIDSRYTSLGSFWQSAVQRAVVGKANLWPYWSYSPTYTLYSNTGGTGPYLGNIQSVSDAPTLSNPILNSSVVSVPANPLALNGANSSTVYTNSSGVVGAVAGDAATQALGQSAADAAEQAYKAAIAAGLSVAAANEAAKAASSAIAAGKTLSEALAAGQAAGQAAEGNISNTKDLFDTVRSWVVPADSSVLQQQFAAVQDAFSSKFPFSLHDDIGKLFPSSSNVGALQYPQLGYWEVDPDQVKRYHIVFDFGGEHQAFSDQFRAIATLALWMGLAFGLLWFALHRKAGMK